MRRRTFLAAFAIAAGLSLAPLAQELPLQLPVKPNSIRFLVIGDSGTGDSEQYETAATIIKYRAKFPFTFAIMLGDNMYGAERPQDFVNKFERPYKPLLDDKVDFHAALGNHDDPNQIFYKPFNFGGKRYHTFKKGGVRFFALDSNYLDPEQLHWLEKELQASGSDWKIAYFHHPLYSSAYHGPTIEVRNALEPMFQKYGVDVVFTGHEHLYERIYPQKGIYYFVEGGSAKLRAHDITRTAEIAAGFDTDRSFMLVEISGNEMFFQTISRNGLTVDSGILPRRQVRTDLRPAAAASAPAPATKP
jgi:predicted phosphodiesterase